MSLTSLTHCSGASPGHDIGLPTKNVWSFPNFWMSVWLSDAGINHVLWCRQQPATQLVPSRGSISHSRNGANGIGSLRWHRQVQKQHHRLFQITGLALQLPAPRPFELQSLLSLTMTSQLWQGSASAQTAADLIDDSITNRKQHQRCHATEIEQGLQYSDSKTKLSKPHVLQAPLVADIDIVSIDVNVTMTMCPNRIAPACWSLTHPHVYPPSADC